MTDTTLAAPRGKNLFGKIRVPLRQSFAWLLIVGGAALPFLVEPTSFILILASHALIAGLLGLSLDMLLGTTGMISFGHAGWYGLGAYVAGITAKAWTPDIFVVVALATVTVAVLAAAVGAVLVQQIGKAFAILTLALGQIMYTAVFIAPSVTGGEDGLQGIPAPTFFGSAIDDFRTWYWVLYAIVIVATFGALLCRRTPLGQAWAAIRENQERARFVGMDVNSLKLLSYIISAAMAGTAGALFAFFNGSVSADALHWAESGKVMMYVILGGVGTFIGPVLGAAVFTVAHQYISSLSGEWLIYFGLLMIFLVLFAPKGIYGLYRRATQRLTGRAAQ
ncbi:branched-chain amino acid ABC transporter permease [Polaromonas sp. C04]|uniref:branched-chain amino acid ABC transporter permease n=1 Tax=Polaromonas sp. C04 TaxID=1945857 RepID=UPI00098436A2|nr:branched-chain amino acid ABC transporter permease [Polaromonas sp. C04]OOG51195.1 branched-chain amino acid ABC transporter permease [Polaromonas sp. C04]